MKVNSLEYIEEDKEEKILKRVFLTGTLSGILIGTTTGAYFGYLSNEK